MSVKLISIITVVYNSDDTLEQTILSVINQNMDYLEYIIIDGGSTDQSIQIIKKYQNYITTWISEPDNGIYDAMNKGVSKAKGKYLMFLNSGDYLTEIFKKSFFDGSLRKLLDKELYDVLYGDVILELNENILKYKKANNLAFLYFKIPFCHQSTLVLKTIFSRYKFDIGYKYGADFKLFRQLYFNSNKFKYVNIPFARYNLSGISSNNPISLLKDYKGIINEDRFNILNFLGVMLTITKIWKHELFSRVK